MLELIPPNAKRVQLNTNRLVNENIRRKMVRNASFYADKSHDDISSRIRELEREWDTERILEASAAILILIGLLLGFKFNYTWFYICGIVAFFLLQHAIQGWCPPLPILRRLGIRTTSEINDEKMVLKALRGDFNMRLR